MNTEEIQSGFLSNAQGVDLFVHLMQGNNDTFWVFCNPILEESVFIRPFYQELAREFHAKGDSVIQFDYAGCGESCGDFSKLRVETMLADVLSLIQQIKADKPAANIRLFGMRIGANIALSVAKSQQYPCLCWLPITDGMRFCDDLLLTNMVIQMSAFGQVENDKEQLLEKLEAEKSVNILGYPVNNQLFHDLQEIAISDLEVAEDSNIHISINQAPANKAMIQRIKSGESSASLVKIKPFWHEPKEYPEKQTELLQAAQTFCGGL